MAVFRQSHALGRYLLSNTSKFNTASSFRPLQQLQCAQCQNIVISNRAISSDATINRLRYSGLFKDNVKSRFSLFDHGRSSILAATVALRHNSSDSTNKLEELIDTPGYIPEPPPLPLPDGASEVFTELGEPTLASLGLCNYTPAGFVQGTLEMIHVSLGVPWWGAIVIGTICIRLLLFPIVIIGQRNAANLGNHMPTVQRLQEKFNTSKKSGNQLEAARRAHELQDYMKRNNVNPLKNMVVPLAQVPIFLSVFTGIRQITSLPVASWETGGILWFNDLTLSDPFYGLPIITALSLFATIHIGADGMRASNLSHTMKYVMRAMPFVMLPIIINFPAGMLCYWCTSNAFSLMQVLFLKMPGMKAYLKIPELVQHDASAMPKKKMVQGFKEQWQNAKLVAEIQDRHKHDALKFKESGTAPLQKTYRHDPTKSTSIAAKPKNR